MPQDLLFQIYQDPGPLLYKLTTKLHNNVDSWTLKNYLCKIGLAIESRQELWHRAILGYEHDIL